MESIVAILAVMAAMFAMVMATVHYEREHSSMIGAYIWTGAFVFLILLAIMYSAERRLSRGGFEFPSSAFSPTIDNKLHQLDWGTISFNVPSRVAYGESFGIQVLLATRVTPTTLEGYLQEDGARESTRIQISQHMQAELAGDAFDITPVTPIDQAVNAAGVTQWRWDVRAKSLGRQNLYLSLNANIKVDGEGLPYSVRTFRRELNDLSAFFGPR